MKAIALVRCLIELFSRIPDDAIALLGRFSIAAIFWKSGQTKIQGFVLDMVSGEFQFAWPHLSDSVVDLFRDEYVLAQQDGKLTTVPTGRMASPAELEPEADTALISQVVRESARALLAG